MDILDRQAFIQNTDANYSVIAPAGVGKTQAIVDRIIAIASRGEGRSVLERLAVVTYTRKAALEIQVRAREGILRAGIDGLTMQAFNKAFFGTTHSFCLELIQEYGPHQGLPGVFTVLEPQQEKALWERFLQEETHLSEILPEEVRTPLLQCIDFWALLDSVLEAPGGEDLSVQSFSKNLLSLEDALTYVSENKCTQALIARTQKSLRDWLVRFNAGEPCLGLPPDYTGSDEGFADVLGEALLPLKDWISHNSLVLSFGIKQRFLNYQLKEGVLSYSSLITLARNLLKHASVREKIREQGLYVILDEAQDATSEQLEILLGVAGVMDPGLVFLAPQKDSGGRFCMVGDPQQSIYGLGSDLPLYLKVHQTLQSLGWAKALQFCITFRCDEAIVDTVNTFFPKVLTSSVRGQVDFERLSPRPGAGPGQVLRFEPELPEAENLDRETLYAQEANAIACWVKETGLGGLRAGGWEQVALLAPRNDWLPALRKAFQEEGFACQDHTRSAILADHPTYAWFCALLAVMDQPWNGFELVGVLREIFGIKDTDIADFTQKNGPVNLETDFSGSGDLYRTLSLLKALRERIVFLPLRKAVAELVRGVDLPSRLAVLDDYPQHTLFSKLDELFSQTSLADESGMRLGAFAQSLRERLQCQDVEVSVQQGCIQFISCHSSKGLQWDAVVLPFLHREIAFGHASYPQFWSLDASIPPALILDKNHKRQRLGGQVSLSQHQELERLLYVATTRAKHTLVFVDDTFFNKNSDGSFASILKVLPGDSNNAAFRALESTAMPGAHDSQSVNASVSGEAPKLSTTFDWEILRAQADSGLKRLTPSGLAHEGGPNEALVFPSSAVDASSGAEYGTFWHNAMELAPWSSGSEAFQEYCLSRSAESPEPQRFEQEVVRFLDSSLAKLLLSDDWAISCEMPFLWRSGDRCYEGIMDLVATHRPTGDIKVVDWKTDLVPQGEHTAAFLVECYGQQISVYQKALSEWKNRSVEGILYSTRLGAYSPLN